MPLAGFALLVAGIPAAAQMLPGTPVDNFAGTGPNAASLRVAQPGLGQFGVNSLLLDRFGKDPYQPQHVTNPFSVDPRVSQRYMLQAQGFAALMDRPDYIGLSPQGGWVFNQQTIDGTEILTLTPANTVYVLNPELLQPTPVRPTAPPDHPNRVQPETRTDPYALMRESRVNRDAYAPVQRIQQPTLHDENYRHPEIIERERKLKEERAREAEQREREAAEQEQAEATSQSKPQDQDQPKD